MQPDSYQGWKNHKLWSKNHKSSNEKNWIWALRPDPCALSSSLCAPAPLPDHHLPRNLHLHLTDLDHIKTFDITDWLTWESLQTQNFIILTGFPAILKSFIMPVFPSHSSRVMTIIILPWINTKAAFSGKLIFYTRDDYSKILRYIRCRVPVNRSCLGRCDNRCSGANNMNKSPAISATRTHCLWCFWWEDLSLLRGSQVEIGISYIFIWYCVECNCLITFVNCERPYEFCRSSR